MTSNYPNLRINLRTIYIAENSTISPLIPRDILCIPKSELERFDILSPSAREIAQLIYSCALVGHAALDYLMGEDNPYFDTFFWIKDSGEGPYLVMNSATEVAFLEQLDAAMDLMHDHILMSTVIKLVTPLRMFIPQTILRHAAEKSLTFLEFMVIVQNHHSIINRQRDYTELITLAKQYLLFARGNNILK